ncbi:MULTISPECIES: DUF2917 domain-containing protein [Cupriavidus]|uniref:DUF2917 domain-containing protein n=1 Tax=Cupriavidus pinatubonensis (strain JMP 134 / LMG 1197) TaxID=264198 RepID=Q46T15_CUPPJ|nr:MULTISPECIES: DUF2917 domain-containing protein [Cupriavidus]QYY28573.1 DUF2917 domain-containing protein [Cupriavidus pinatubonensis]
MPSIFTLQAECRRLQLQAGVELACRGGSVWLTFETRDRTSEDVVLAPGERYRLRRDAEVFVAALHGAGPALCEIDAPSLGHRVAVPWLRWLRDAWTS